MKKSVTSAFLIMLLASSANAALVSKLGGLAYYDTLLDITWLADANRAKTSGYDADGLMTWSAAQGWIGTLNSSSYLGASNWRLPTVKPVGTIPPINYQYTFSFNGSTDWGYNESAPGSASAGSTASEMAHLFYKTLGNTGFYNTSGVATGCSVSSPFCLTNDGDFINLQSDYYWSDTVNEDSALYAFDFQFSNGSQSNWDKTNTFYAWAVSPGDIAPVPVPAAAWLFGGALALLGALRRRAMTALA